MKLTFPHIAAYVTGALTWLASLNPTFVTAIVGPKLSALVVPAIPLAGAVLVFIHDVAPAKPPSVTTAAKLLAVMALVPLMLLSLPGCSYMSALIAPAAQPFVLAGVDVAVAQAVTDVSKKTGETPTVVAARIKKTAQQILIADNSVNTTVATLEMDLNAKILALKLPPPELQAALVLAASLEAALTAYIQTTPKGQIVATTQIAIADIANAVITAAGAYGA